MPRTRATIRTQYAATALARALAGAMLGLSGCQPPTQPGPARPSAAVTAQFQPVRFADLPGWAEDDLSAALPPFRATCARLAALPADRTLGGVGLAAERGGTPSAWRPACEAARTVPSGDQAAARAFWEAWFEPWRMADAATGRVGLFTGYYEPEVAGSRAAGARYRTPLLGRPADLVPVDLGLFDPQLKGRHIVGRLAEGRLVPYWDRAQIEAGALAGQHLTLLWLTDPVDLSVLQIQGSGRVRLPDGSARRVSYDGQNGRAYVPIGRVLADRGAIPRAKVSMQSIRAWLAAHPDQVRPVLDQDPSYVFFRELGDLRPDQGPPGALGVLLAPGRSAAIDQHVLPLGAPLFVATEDPVSGQPFRRLLQAQDVGGAIRGAVRADIFWGWGADAEARAGLMKAQGTDYVLLPKAGASLAAR